MKKVKNVTLLDLRNDDDWILLPMYNEPLRLRNATAHQLWEDMHEPYYLENKPEAQSGVRGRYIELFLNGEYRGIYFLTERVDRKLLKLQHYSQSEGMQGELYKGKQWGSGTVTFYNVGLYNNNSRWWDGYQKKYPLEEMTTNWQRLYDLKAFTIQAPDSLFVSDIGSKFHLTNAVDYFIFLNLIHSIDNSGKNIFVARHSQADPYFYVPWDLDAVFGQDWEGVPTQDFSGLITNGLYDRLIEHCDLTGFGLLLNERWNTLRQGLITSESIYQRIMAHHNLLLDNGGYAREEMAWPAYSYNAQALNYMSQWMENRIQLLDQIFAELCTFDTGNLQILEKHTSFIVFPNPSNGELNISGKLFADNESFEVRDKYGRIVRSGSLHSKTTHLDLTDLPAGIYFVMVLNDVQSMVVKWIKVR